MALEITTTFSIEKTIEILESIKRPNDEGCLDMVRLAKSLNDRLIDALNFEKSQRFDTAITFQHITLRHTPFMKLKGHVNPKISHVSRAVSLISDEFMEQSGYVKVETYSTYATSLAQSIQLKEMSLVSEDLNEFYKSLLVNKSEIKKIASSNTWYTAKLLLNSAIGLQEIGCTKRPRKTNEIILGILEQNRHLIEMGFVDTFICTKENAKKFCSNLKIGWI